METSFFNGIVFIHLTNWSFVVLAFQASCSVRETTVCHSFVFVSLVLSLKVCVVRQRSFLPSISAQWILWQVFQSWFHLTYNLAVKMMAGQTFHESFSIRAWNVKALSTSSWLGLILPVCYAVVCICLHKLIGRGSALSWEDVIYSSNTYFLICLMRYSQELHSF